MTIGIAVALHDSVLLVADGRRSDAYRVHSDETEKVMQLRDDLGLIIFGAEIGTDMAIASLRIPGELPNDALAVAEKLKGLALGCASYVLALVIPEDRSMARIKVGLVAGGFDTGGPYLTGSLYGADMKGPDSTLLRAYRGGVQRILLGGEDAGAHEYFDRAAQHVLVTLGARANDSTVLLPHLLNVAESTVRYAAARDRTIGGRIMYHVMRPGKPIEVGFR